MLPPLRRQPPSFDALLVALFIAAPHLHSHAKPAFQFALHAEGRIANAIRYLPQYHLGSTRVISHATSLVKARCDYRPFDELLQFTTADAQRNLIREYACAEGVNQPFTGKERDAESYLGYFGAWYMASAQRRFARPSPIIMMG